MTIADTSAEKLYAYKFISWIFDRDGLGLFFGQRFGSVSECRRRSTTDHR